MTAEGPPERRNVLGRIPVRVWVALVILIGVVVFVAQNRQSTEIHFLMVSVAAPLWATLTGAVVAGLLLGLLLMPSIRRRRRR
ncbi:lipopolysaccharide assembly protein LapA domain-containing protein [Nocardiopsis sp. EMB25]|uniref:lipopolysaccharide assembly protein LapA domain-containing protein n=1 Tax=Nocardiopsis sp. EMB25 TaxID=2835867 RepID=UPI002283A2A9|nr:lipopolysaccharide assembly protein LapA domain-containing protein [Nocardiopsis sp. EMB25]MCY9787431.1 lipopolysaccharide assembly protein LapA domain-containing protein [Nocardiopsis sp. EMB25]